MSIHEVRAGFDPQFVRTRRIRRMAMLSVAATLLHAAVLSEVAWTWPQAATMTHAPAVQFRLVASSTQQAAELPPPAPAPNHVASRSARPSAVRLTVAAIVPVVHTSVRTSALPDVQLDVRPEIQAAPDERPTPVVQIPTVAELAQATDSAGPKTGAETSAAEAAPAEEPIPRYRTRMPPAVTLRYDLQRGILHGNGDLTWQPRGDQYEIKLEGKVGALAVLTQTSTGGFDADGIAPQRFVDQRFRRAAAAANFQRAIGTITFSGPSTEYPLRAGSQDRLSWMVQLAAIVAAEPRLRSPGSKIAMNVASAQGDAGVWVFRCVGPETIDVGATSLEAIKFVREPREPHDTDVQVWLDPQRYHLPVRARQQSGPTDEPFELRLRETVSGN